LLDPFLLFEAHSPYKKYIPNNKAWSNYQPNIDLLTSLKSDMKQIVENMYENIKM